MAKLFRAGNLLFLVLLTTLAGCATRSISNSGFHGGSYYGGNPFYHGELREFDIIGQLAPSEVSEEAILKTYQQAQAPLRLARGSQIMIIQSGAITPDDEFLSQLGMYFSAVPFSGTPAEKKQDLVKQLRMAAAQGGIRTILCYWGILESATTDHASKAVSWIPVAGRVVPDEKQQMRIRLKAIVLDVPTGKWSMVTPPAIEESRTSAKLNRESADQKQVLALKRKGYESLVQHILAKHG